MTLVTAFATILSYLAGEEIFNTTSIVLCMGQCAVCLLYTSQQIVSAAYSFLGIPYVWGGTTTAGFDCSGMVQAAPVSYTHLDVYKRQPLYDRENQINPCKICRDGRK